MKLHRNVNGGKDPKDSEWTFAGAPIKDRSLSFQQLGIPSGSLIEAVDKIVQANFQAPNVQSQAQQPAQSTAAKTTTEVMALVEQDMDKAPGALKHHTDKLNSEDLESIEDLRDLK